MNAIDVIFYGILFLIGIFYVISRIRNVPITQRLVIFRLGKVLEKPKGPGYIFLIPFFDHARKVDLREQGRKVSKEQATTKDSVPVSIDYSLIYKVFDPVKMVLSAPNVEVLMMGIVSTKLKKIILEVDSGDLPAEFERIRHEMSTDAGLREIFERFGVVVAFFEVSNLVVDDRKLQMDAAKTTIGTYGQTQTAVHSSGTVLLGDKTWDAMSGKPIAANSKVRVRRVILEIEEETSLS